jgi:hypothetical protein
MARHCSASWSTSRQWWRDEFGTVSGGRIQGKICAGATARGTIRANLSSLD